MASAWIHNQIDSRYDLGAFRLVFALALILLFVENSWAACTQATSYFYSNRTNQMNGTCDPGSVIAPAHSCSNGDAITYRYTCYNDGPPYMTDFKFDHCTSWGDYGYYTYYHCSSRCEAQEYECNKKGWSWDAANCVCNDPTLCAPYREQCEEIGGKFNGLVSEGCCRAVCNICGGESFTKLYDMKRKICCDRMQSPPLERNVCYTDLLPPSECGMNWSDIKDLTSAEWACRDPSLSFEAAQNYREQCFERSSSSADNQSSSSGGGDGSSSSGASPYPEGCEECPWLDSILDTLTLQKQKVDEIYSCLTIPGLCGETTPASSSGTPVPIDSSAVPLLDSANRIGEKQIIVLQELDSLLKKLNSKDSIALMNDSNTWKELYFITKIITDDIQTSNDTSRKWLRRLADSLRALNVSNRLYLGYLADSIGISVDSLVGHIDSIKNSIPKDVFDSILKYQKQFAESRDSIVVDGLPALDSMIDSSLKYWKLGLHYDSIYHKNYGDSLGSIHDAISDVGNGVGYALGYGDTASSTLRKDLSDIIDILGGGGTISAFDSAVAANGGGVVDTSGVHLDIYGGGLLSDSIAHDVGYGKIDVARDTADFNAALSAGYEETDSTLCVGSECVSYDSDSKIADSAQRYIARQGDSIRASNQAFYKDSVDSYFQQIKDTLSKLNPFGMFDSTLMKTLGAKVPNSNTCPEHCSKYRVDIPFIFANLGIDLDWQLCASWAVLGGQNVMSFLRFIIRVIVAVTCISMIMHAAANTKLK